MGGREPALVRYGKYAALVFDFLGIIGAGAVVGYTADRWLGTEPWAVVLCTLAAVVGGFVHLVELLRRFERREHRGDREGD